MFSFNSSNLGFPPSVSKLCPTQGLGGLEVRFGTSTFFLTSVGLSLRVNLLTFPPCVVAQGRQYKAFLAHDFLQLVVLLLLPAT